MTQATHRVPKPARESVQPGRRPRAAGLPPRLSIRNRYSIFVGFMKVLLPDSNLGQLKGDVAPVSDDLGTDLHQLLPQCGQWPVFDFLGQRQRPLLATSRLWLG